MTVFDWDKIRPKLHKEATRDATIAAAFQQYIEGNSRYDDLTSAEMRGLFDVFRPAWVICEHVIGGNHE